MAGFYSDGTEDVVVADNVNFTGTTSVGEVNADGQLLIGSSIAPFLKAALLTSSDGSVTFTPGHNTLSLQVAGGTTTGKTITGNSGGALSPTAGNWNIVGTGSLTSAGAGSTLTFSLTGLTANTVLYGQGSATIGLVAVGTTGQVLQANTGLPPTWGTLSGIAVTTATGTAPITVNGDNAAHSGAITIALTTPLALQYGGTNANLTASNGGIFYSTATAGAILSGTATARQMLQSGASAAPAWSTATWPATTTAQQLLYSSATNTVSEVTASIDGVLISSHATGAPSWLANGTAGQVLTANSGAPPSWQNAAVAFTWSVITADQTAVVNNGYICNKGSALVLTLPASAAIGDIIEVTGINTALGWKIAQNANQQIFFGTSSTTVGATGFIQSTAIRDSLRMVCVVSGASTVWNVLSAVGNLTVS